MYFFLQIDKESKSKKIFFFVGVGGWRLVVSEFLTKNPIFFSWGGGGGGGGRIYL